MAEFIVKDFIPVAYPGGNRITIETATGKVLGAPKPGWNSEIPQAMKEWAKLPASEKKPKEVPPAKVYRLPPPPGGLVLRVYTRGLERDAGGKLKAIALHSEKYSGPQRNFFWLTRQEWHALVPGKDGPQKFKFPEPIVRRLFRHHLIDNTVGLSGSWDDKHLRAAELWAIEVPGEGKTRQWRLEGSARLANDADGKQATHKGDFTCQGKAVLDVATGQFQSFDLVAVGEYENANVRDYYEKVGQRKSLLLGVAFELAEPGSFGYGSVPFALWQGIHSCRPDSPQVQRYFGTNPYQK